MMINQIKASEAFLLLQNSSNSTLIDVRTNPEFLFAGVPDLSSINASPLFISWKLFPEMNINPNFADELNNALHKKFGNDKFDSNLIFICLSGGRSNQAAFEMQNYGYKNCFNIVNGFEGDADSSGKRGNLNGWKASDLPWRHK